MTNIKTRKEIIKVFVNNIDQLKDGLFSASYLLSEILNENKENIIEELINERKKDILIKTEIKPDLIPTKKRKYNRKYGKIINHRDRAMKMYEYAINHKHIWFSASTLHKLANGKYSCGKDLSKIKFYFKGTAFNNLKIKDTGRHMKIKGE